MTVRIAEILPVGERGSIAAPMQREIAGIVALPMM
jgi:hypothetical protein